MSTKKLIKALGLIIVVALLAAALPLQAKAQTSGNTLYVADWSDPAPVTIGSGESAVIATGRETVLKVGDTYHMWYSSSDEKTLYHTSSEDPTSFVVGTAVTFPTDHTPFEVGSVSVVKEGGTFYMIAYGDTNKKFAIYTSSDGNTWTYGSVVFDGTGITNLQKIDGPYLIKIGDNYRLYFQLGTGDDYASRTYDIYVAESTSITGTYTLRADPVLIKGDAGAWDSSNVMHPWVIKDGDVYYMWYSAYGSVPQKIGFAYSSDGYNWTKSRGNPIIDDQNLGYGEPSVIKDGDTWRMWALGVGKINYYESTGPFEFQSIQAAIDAASAGDTVNVAAGTYHENLAGWKDMEITKSLNLIGAGSESTIIELSEGSGLGGKMNGLEIRGANLDVLIQGITFTKKPGNTYATSYPIRVAETTSAFNKLTFKDVEVAYGEASNVILGGAGTFNELIVEDSNFHHAGTWGFLSSGTVHKVTITNSNFEYNGQKDPLHGNGLDFAGPLSENITITGGSFSYNKHNGLLLMSAKNVLISGVQANNNAGATNGGFGIAIDEWRSKTSNVVIQNSTANNNSFDGISIQPEKVDAIDGVAITGCTLSNNGRNGLNLNYINSGTNNPEMHNISIHNSTITGNGSYGVRVWSWWVTMEITEVFDATNNWWGNAAGPGASQISGEVDFTPWCTDANCQHTAPDASGNVNLSGNISVPGGILVNEPGITYHLAADTFIKNSSPCFVVNADHTQIIAEPGAKCIPTEGANGIDVVGGLTDIRVKGLEILPDTGATAGDGIHFAGAINGVVLADNKIHNLGGDGVEFVESPTGTVDIHGNLFASNVGLGINNSDATDATTVAAEYNSWGSFGGPTGTGGDGVSANVDADPWTHADITVAPVITNTTSRVVTTLDNVSGRPTVLKDGNVYHMWYGPDDTHLYHTSSTNPAEFPVGVETTFDTKPLEVASPAIIKEGDTFYMIAYGVDNTEFALYTSANGNTWTKVGIVFDGNTHFTTDFGKIDAPFLFKLDSGYRLYFQVKNAAGTRYDIYAAESTTIGGTYGLVNNDNPVLSPAVDTTAWDGKYVMHPWVVFDGTTYYMWFSAHNDVKPQQIGVATSTNGLAWTKSAANPVIGPVGEPAVIKDGNIWRIWYLGAGNSVKYQSALNPLDLRQTLAYQVTANLQNVIAADVTLNFPQNLLSIAEITPGPAFNDVTFDTLSDGKIQFVGSKLETPIVPVTGEDVVLFTVAFHTDAEGSDDIAFGPATFGMAGVESSSNVYLAASTDTASPQVNELPTLTTTFGDADYLAGIAQNFQVVITNKGTAYADAELRLTVPTGVALTLNSEDYTLSEGGVVVLGLDANETVTLTFSATISSAGAKTISFDVYDASSLLFSTVETATVNGDFAITGTFSMQGRVTRGGIPVTLTWTGTGPTYAESDNTEDLLENNFQVTVTYGGGYLITTDQPRYLNLTTASNRTITVDGAEILNALMLRGGNVVNADTSLDKIDLSDAGMIGGAYGTIGNPADIAADANFDGKVNILDLALVGGNYLLTTATAYTSWAPLP